MDVDFLVLKSDFCDEPCFISMRKYEKKPAFQGNTGFMFFK